MARRSMRRPRDPPGAGELRRVSIDQIDVPRRRLRRDLGDVGSLAASLDAYGQLAPVVCYIGPDNRLRLIAGERRLEATRRLHAARMAAGQVARSSVGEIDVLVRSVRPGQAPAELELIENEQRRELTDEEEADAFIQLAREAKRNLQQLAEMSGRSVAYVSKRIRVFEDPRLREAIARGEVATSQAEELLALPEPVRAELLERSARERWTHDQMRRAARALSDRARAGDRGLTEHLTRADRIGRGDAADQPADDDEDPAYFDDDADVAPSGRPSGPSFRLETSATASPGVSTARPPDLTRRIRELDTILADLRPFQLSAQEDRALVSLWRTLRRLAQAGRGDRRK